MGTLVACVRLDRVGHSKHPWQIADWPERGPGPDVPALRCTSSAIDAPLLAAARSGCKATWGAQTALSAPALLSASLSAISRNIRRTMRNKCSGKRLLRDEARVDLCFDAAGNSRFQGGVFEATQVHKAKSSRDLDQGR